MPYYVQVYRSTDLNSPPISGQVGAIFPALDQCLIDGYGWSGMSITALTRSGSTATATVSVANGLKLKTGMILTMSGAVETDYNITATITVSSTTQFTYTVAGTPTTPATGTPVASSYLKITTITRGGAGNLTATVTMTNTNQTLITGNYLTISGCTGTGNAQYNGTFQITVTSSITFTYQMVSDPTASASGSPVYAKAGLQWTRPFAAGTNSKTYKSQATVGALAEVYSPMAVQVVDNGVIAASQCEVYGAEVFESDQVVTSGRFPTTAQKATGGVLKKATAANTTLRDWALWGDEKTFTLGIANVDIAAISMQGSLSFGYFIPTKVGDLYNTFIAFNSQAAIQYYTGSWAVSWLAGISAAATSFYIPRSFTQFGTAQLGSLCVPYMNSVTPAAIGGISTAWISYPNQPNSGYYVQPVLITELSGNIRGRMPGIYGPLMTANSLTHYDTVTNVVGLSGITLLVVSVINLAVTGQVLVDQFGPWV